MEKMPADPKPTRKKKKPRKIPPAIVMDVLERDDYQCTECGRGYPHDDHAFHMHHIIKTSQGGKDVADNLKTICWECHALEHR